MDRAAPCRTCEKLRYNGNVFGCAVVSSDLLMSGSVITCDRKVNGENNLQELWDRAKVIESPPESIERKFNIKNKIKVMADKVYAKGVVAFAPHEKAPKFVVGAIVISPEVLQAWCAGEGAQWLTDYNGTKQIKLQITRSEDGKLSIAVDTYRKPA